MMTENIRALVTYRLEQAVESLSNRLMILVIKFLARFFDVIAKK